MPGGGPLPVDVPGVVEGWSQLLHALRHHHAGEGAAARDPLRARRLPGAGDHGRRLAATRRRSSSQDPAAAATFLPNGRAPKARRDLRQSAARALASSSSRKGGRDAFYKGPIARAIVADMRARNGLLDERDFADAHRRLGRPDLDQLSRLRRARDAAEHAGLRRARDAEHPRGLRHQGDGPQHAPTTCTLVTEAKKIAFADRAAYLADRDAMPKDVLKTLLSKDYAAARRKEIDMQKTGSYRPARARRRDAARRRRLLAARSRRHDLHDRRRRSGQRHLADPVALRQLRRRHRRRRDRHHAAQSRLRAST